MKYGEFKKLLNLKTKGDVQLPKDEDEIQLLLQESLENVSYLTIPIELVTQNTTDYFPLRFINSESFIRKSVLPQSNEISLDIDDRLHYAVLYDFLSLYLSDTTRSKRALDKRDLVIQDYVWSNKELIDALEEG